MWLALSVWTKVTQGIFPFKIGFIYIYNLCILNKKIHGVGAGRLAILHKREELAKYGYMWKRKSRNLLQFLLLCTGELKGAVV